MGTPRTAFDAGFGTTQGRIEPAVYTNLAGAYVFQLGHEQPGVVRTFAAGDVIRIEHTFDASAVRKFRFRARFRKPASVPAGWEWTFSARLNSHEFVSRVIDRDIETIDTAMAVEAEIVAAGSPNVTMSFRLTARGPFGTFAELEIPGCWVDAITDDSSGPLIDTFSRSPEPGERQVPLASTVRFVVMLMDGSTTLIGTDLRVTIGTEIAVLNGVAQPGYTVGIGNTLFPLLCGVTVTITRAMPFPPLTTIPVLLRIPSRAYDLTWSFTTEDMIAPVVASAFAPTPTTVRVRFDEHIAADAAIVAANYALSLVDGAPAVLPLIVSVELESDTSVILTLDRIMTRGATYLVTVINVEDVFGNVVAAPNDTASFIGYVWPAYPGRDVSLWQRLPEVMRERDEGREHERFIGVMQELLDVYYGLADRALDIVDPDYAPIAWVDIMLSDLGNPFDFLDLTEIEKRILAQTLIPLYRTKGTGPGIVNAARFFLGIDVTIRVYAWAPYPIGEAIIGQTFVLGSSVQADLYTFEVVVDVFLTATQRKNLTAIIEYMKVAHEHWRLIEPTVPVVVDHWAIGFSRLGTESILHA